jgi:hypothetical protein
MTPQIVETAIGALCLLGGFVLAAAGVGSEKSDSSVKFLGMEIKLERVGPGVIFAVLGVVLVVFGSNTNTEGSVSDSRPQVAAGASSQGLTPTPKPQNRNVQAQAKSTPRESSELAPKPRRPYHTRVSTEDEIKGTWIERPWHVVEQASCHPHCHPDEGDDLSWGVHFPSDLALSNYRLKCSGIGCPFDSGTIEIDSVEHVATVHWRNRSGQVYVNLEADARATCASVLAYGIADVDEQVLYEKCHSRITESPD